MRILIVTPYLPWPLDSGGNAAQFSTLRCLTGDHEFVLVAPVHGNQSDHSAALRRELPGVEVRAVRCGDAPVKAGLARRAMRKGLRKLQAWAGEPAPKKSGLPYDPIRVLPREFLQALDEEVAKGVDLIQVEFADMLALAGWLPPGIPSLFIQHQIHFIYTERAMETCVDWRFRNHVVDFVRSKELALLRKFDSVITFSGEDRQVLVTEGGLSHVEVSPFPAPSDIGFVDAAAGEFRGEFCFLGSEGHYPNLEGLIWLMDEIWPLILEALPAARLKVFGTWGEALREKAGRFGASVVFAGFVDEVGKEIFGGIQLVPLRIGSGIRTKILAALAQGVPCVSTAVGAEGLEAGRNGGVLLADSPADFAAAAVSLAANAEEWRRHAAAGLESVSRLHSPEAVRIRRNNIYCQLVQQVDMADPGNGTDRGWEEGDGRRNDCRAYQV